MITSLEEQQKDEDTVQAFAILRRIERSLRRS
jgi:hypothetical protein